MLSGGNPTGGANPSGSGTSINYIGEHAYAYSGNIVSSQTRFTALKFSTGNRYIVGRLNFTGFIDDDQPATRDAGMCALLINGEESLLLATGSDAIDATSVVYAEILLPSNSEIIVEVESVGAAADNFCTVGITGRVYG